MNNIEIIESGAGKLIVLLLTTLTITLSCNDNSITSVEEEGKNQVQPKFEFEITGDLSLSGSYDQYESDPLNHYYDLFGYNNFNQRKNDELRKHTLSYISIVIGYPPNPSNIQKRIFLYLATDEFIREREYQTTNHNGNSFTHQGYDGLFGVHVSYIEDRINDDGSFGERIDVKQYLSSPNNGKITITKVTESKIQGEVEATLGYSANADTTISINSAFTIDLAYQGAFKNYSGFKNRLKY